MRSSWPYLFFCLWQDPQQEFYILLSFTASHSWTHFSWLLPPITLPKLSCQCLNNLQIIENSQSIWLEPLAALDRLGSFFPLKLLSSLLVNNTTFSWFFYYLLFFSKPRITCKYVIIYNLFNHFFCISPFILKTWTPWMGFFLAYIFNIKSSTSIIVCLASVDAQWIFIVYTNNSISCIINVIQRSIKNTSDELIRHSIWILNIFYLVKDRYFWVISFQE